jgi:hypothetical protein
MEPSPSSYPPRPVTPPSGRARVGVIARAVGRSCSRPGCDTPASATLVFSYDEQVARLLELLDDREPQAYDLCERHADRTSPPRGWEISDARVKRDEAPRRLSDDSTVSVIAAALRGEHEPTGRVEVLVGGHAAVTDTPVEDAPNARVPAAVAADDTWIDDLNDDADDPLRAALEEVQRVVEPDPSVPGAVPTPLRRRDESKLW